MISRSASSRSSSRLSSVVPISYSPMLEVIESTGLPSPSSAIAGNRTPSRSTQKASRNRAGIASAHSRQADPSPPRASSRAAPSTAARQAWACTSARAIGGAVVSLFKTDAQATNNPDGADPPRRSRRPRTSGYFFDTVRSSGQ